MKPLRPLAASLNPNTVPAGTMPVAAYLQAVEHLSADDPAIDTPVHIPPGWVLPVDAVLGKDFLWIAKHILGVNLFEQQVRILATVQTNPRVSVRACQASGKSYASAALAVAFLLANKDAVVITTAPTARQVTSILWAAIAEIVRASRLPLPGDLLQTSYKLAPNRFALGFVSQAGTGESMAVRFQGYHGEHALVVVDEASGVEQSVYDSLRGSLTSQDSHLLLIGNPNETSGYFFDSHNSLRHLFCPLHISYHDTPNFQGHGEVAPYLITKRFVEEAMAEWGIGNPQFDVRVLGEFPQQSSNALIPLVWAEQATRREAPAAPARPVFEMGVDVARFGNDETAVCIRSGDEVVLLEAWSKFDTMYSADRVVALAKKYRVAAIRIDAVGVGAGVVDRLRQLQDAGELPLATRLAEFNAAAKPRDPERYRMRRDETWQGLRDRFKEGRIANLPDDQKLIGQLCSIRFFFDASNRMQCESKDKLKDRGLKSPDRAEALMLAFTVDRPVGEGQTFEHIMENAVGGGLFKVDLDDERLQW